MTWVQNVARSAALFLVAALVVAIGGCAYERSVVPLDDGAGARTAVPTNLSASGTAYVDDDVLAGNLDDVGPFLAYRGADGLEIVGWYYTTVGVVRVGTSPEEAAARDDPPVDRG